MADDSQNQGPIPQGPSMFYQQQSFEDRDNLVHTVLIKSFKLLRESMEEFMRGTYAKDQQGNVLLEDVYEVYTDEKGKRQQRYMHSRPKIVGKPFLKRIDGEFASEAFEGIMAQISAYLSSDTPLSNLTDNDISHFMINACTSFAIFMAENNTAWQLDKSVHKIMIETFERKLYQAITRSNKSLEWGHIENTSKMHQNVTMNDSRQKSDEVKQNGGLFSKRN